MTDSIDMLLAAAYRNLDRMDGSLDSLQSIIDRHSVVVAIWPDMGAADGVGTSIIKGLQLVREVAAVNVQRPDVVVTAIPCADAKEASRLTALLGEPDRVH